MRNGERGQATIMMALFMGLVMMGFLGFALDVGYFFQQKRQAQVAADAAAVAAAEEYSNPSTAANAQNAANAIAALNGFDPNATTNPATVTLSLPGSGNYATTSPGAASGWVQATVTKPVPAFFLRAFNGTRTMNIMASAIAGEGETSPTCVCLEGSTGQDLNINNGSLATGSACGIVANSNSSNAVAVSGGSTLSTLSLGTVSSTWNNSTNYASNVNNGGSISSNTDVVTGLPSPACSPPMPTVPPYSSCSGDPSGSYQGGASFNVGPGSGAGTTTNGNTVCYNSMTVGSNGQTVTINPGIYVINGGQLHFESGTQLGGSGVFFYLANGASLVIDNGAHPNLSAATSGTYQNILLYQPSTDTNALNFQGGSGTNLNGGVYAPGAPVTIGNGSGSTFSMFLVASTLTITGGATLNAPSNSSLGAMDISSASLRQ
jgi:Flp pilus assembly protein TadG